MDEEKEEQKGELLTNLSSTMVSLSSRKEQIAPAQRIVNKKNEECLKKLIEEKGYILNIVTARCDSLIREAANQKEESKREMTSVQENLDLLNNIRAHIDQEALALGDVESCTETASSIIQRTNDTLLVAPTFEYVEYNNCEVKERLVEQLCGGLIKKQYDPESGQSVNVTIWPPSAASNGSQCQSNPEGLDENVATATDGTARTLNATSLAERLGSCSQSQQVLPKFQRKYC